MIVSHRGISRPTNHLILLLCAAHFMAMVDRNLFSAILPLLREAFGLPDRLLGLLQGTVFAVAYVVGSLIAARLTVRLSRMLMGGLLLWTLGEIVCAGAAGIGGLAAGQVAMGLGQAAFIPAALTAVAAADQRPLGGAVSRFTASSALGRSASVFGAGLIMTVVAAAGIEAIAPWRAVFVAAALLGLALICCLAMHGATAPLDALASQPSRPRQGRIGARGRAVLMVMLTTMPLILSLQALAAWMPTLCVRRYAMPPATAALLVGGITMVTAPLGQLLGGNLFDRAPAIARQPLVAIATCVAVASIGVGVIAATDTPLPALSALAAINIALGIGSLTGLLMLQILVVPPLRAKVNALFLALVTGIGLGMGPLIVGVLSDGHGATGSAVAQALLTVSIGAFAVCAAMAAIGHRLALFGARRVIAR